MDRLQGEKEKASPFLLNRTVVVFEDYFFVFGVLKGWSCVKVCCC